MKSPIIFFIFILTTIISNVGYSQATNLSNDIWIINYYGATTVVPTPSINLPITVGTDCSAGISVTVQSPPDCTVNTPTPNIVSYSASCTSGTTSIEFNATVDPLGPINCVPDRYVNPEFIFEL